jgi:hypothetical protein
LAATQKASVTARHRAATKARKATTFRLASRSLFRSVPLKRAKHNPSATAEMAIENRREFAGQFNGFKNVYAAAGTPDGLSRLGVLAELALMDKSKLSLRKQNVLFLAQDTKQKIHVVSSEPGPMVDNKPGDYGEIKTVEYIESKPHLGSNELIQWVHKMGELTGKRPRLIVDSNGQLRLKGGDYSINWRGIIN